MSALGWSPKTCQQEDKGLMMKLLQGTLHPAVFLSVLWPQVSRPAAGPRCAAGRPAQSWPCRGCCSLYRSRTCHWRCSRWTRHEWKCWGDACPGHPSPGRRTGPHLGMTWRNWVRGEKSNLVSSCWGSQRNFLSTFFCRSLLSLVVLSCPTLSCYILLCCTLSCHIMQYCILLCRNFCHILFNIYPVVSPDTSNRVSMSCVISCVPFCLIAHLLLISAFHNLILSVKSENFTEASAFTGGEQINLSAEWWNPVWFRSSSSGRIKSRVDLKKTDPACSAGSSSWLLSLSPGRPGGSAQTACWR